MNKKFTKLSFHQGKALERLAETYSTLNDVILENVQNALDVDVKADKIHITINYKNKTVVIEDNGKGSSEDKFNLVLASVADPMRSVKMKREKGKITQSALGQFALGLISPLNKCQIFTFISCPHPHKYGFQEWMFDCATIIAQKDDLVISVKPRPDLTLDESPPRGQCKVWWRTQVTLIDFNPGYISKIEMDSLIGDIQDRYTTVMRRNKVTISIVIIREDGNREEHLNVRAANFCGKKLPEYVVDNDYAGKVAFNLYISPKTRKGRIGKVVMGKIGDDYRFPFHNFVSSASEVLAEEVGTALMSGLFEGEITAANVRIHPNRKNFQKDDSFVGLCIAVEEWFRKRGCKYIEEIKQDREDERYQELGLKSLKVIEALLRLPENELLLEVINTFKRGTVGLGHTEPDKVVEIQDQPSISVDGDSGQKRKPKEKDGKRRREKAKEENEEHHPLSVMGPKGRPRRVVKSSSLGLQLVHEPKEGSNILWELDSQNGILSFNIRHPLWAACGKTDSTLMKLQEIVAIQALTLEMLPETFRVQQRQILDELNHPLAHWLINSDKARRKK